MSYAATLHFRVVDKKGVAMAAAARNSRGAVEAAPTSWSLFKAVGLARKR